MDVNTLVLRMQNRIMVVTLTRRVCVLGMMQTQKTCRTSQNTYVDLKSIYGVKISSMLDVQLMLFAHLVFHWKSIRTIVVFHSHLYLSVLQDFLGRMECTLGEIVSSSRLERKLQWAVSQYFAMLDWYTNLFLLCCTYNSHTSYTLHWVFCYFATLQRAEIK